MKALALLLLFAWPWSKHVEKFTVTVSFHGMTSYAFKKAFPKPPTCTSNARGLEWYTDHVVVHGVPGDVVTGQCQ